MPFHIHFPRPLHGWKAFFNEITVIVIGVLIALGLEAGVEQLHWQSKGEDGRQRLKSELRWIASSAAEHIATAPCVESQLRALEARVLASADTMEPLPIVPGGMSVSSIRIPRRLWASSTWEALQQDGTTNHLATREQGLLGSTYELAFIMRRYREQYEIRDATFRLASLPIPLTPDIKSNLLREMSGQLGQTKAGVVYASQLITNLRMSGLAPSDGEIDATFSISNGQTATTIQYCKERGLPLADWRAEVAKVNPAVLAR